MAEKERAPKGSEYWEDVFRYCYARLGNREDAEDAAIETIAVVERPSLIPRSESSRKVFAFGVARRKIADRLRKRGPLAEQILEEPSASLNEDVWTSMWSLDEDHCEVLTLRFLLGLSADDAAKVMERSPAAIDSLVQRAKASFQALYLDQSKEPPCKTK